MSVPQSSLYQPSFAATLAEDEYGTAFTTTERRMRSLARKDRINRIDHSRNFAVEAPPGPSSPWFCCRSQSKARFARIDGEDQKVDSREELGEDLIALVRAYLK